MIEISTNSRLRITYDFISQPLAQFDDRYSTKEYEYRIENTDVLFRLLQSQEMDPQTTKWEVRDGVVQESEIRAEYKDRGRTFGTAEKAIKDLKQQTEWHRLDLTSWNGFKYFVLSRDLPTDAARRYFRQEIERLIGGAEILAEAWQKFGYEVQQTKYGGQLSLTEGRPKPSGAEIKAAGLNALYDEVRVSYAEWMMSPNILKQLQALLGDE